MTLALIFTFLNHISLHVAVVVYNYKIEAENQ